MMAVGLELSCTTYNLHGFNQGYPLLCSLCSHSDIIMIQEHWLPPFDLFKLDTISSEFTSFASSAMTHAVQSDILKGRPFGGVAILVRNNIASKVKCICKMERCIMLRLDNLILVNLYMPCKSVDNYSDVFAEVLACVYNYCNSNSNCDILIGGDFNCELAPSERVLWPIIRDFMTDCDLDLTDHLITGNDAVYTYCQHVTGASSHIDHFIVSRHMLNCVQSVKIVDDGSNLSDHLPVSLVCNVTSAVMCSDANAAVLSDTVADCFHLRWDKADLISYYQCSYNLLSSIDVRCLDSGPAGVEYCYQAIVDSLKMAALKTVPCKRQTFYKFWWDFELDKLKEMSMGSHNIWKQAGKPRHGPVYEAKRISHYNYKLAVKRKKESHQDEFTNELHECLLNKDMVSFWKSWHSKFGGKKPAKVIEGLINPQDIAGKFADMFEAVSRPNNISINAAYVSNFNSRIKSHVSTSAVAPFSVFEIEQCIRKLKHGKAPGFDGLSIEHITNCHPVLVVQIACLFNCMLRTGYVPDAFGMGVIIPLIKNVDGNAGSADNYRGITLSPILSKLFELCLLLRVSDFLTSSELQFGFKEKFSCTHAIFIVKEVLSYFNKQHTTVTMAALDISKAFDKVNHYVLFNKLLDRDVPICLIHVLMNWYGKCKAVVRWQSAISHSFRILAGVRQGGVLSPLLFAVYIDGVIRKLESSGLGCKIHGLFAGCILYADDIILLAHTSFALQHMLDICYDEITALDLQFNSSKSVIMRVGPRWDRPCVGFDLGPSRLKFVDSLKYLGIYLKTGKMFSCSYEHVKYRFYSQFNALYSRSKASDSELVSVELMKSFCMPIVLYGLEATVPKKSTFATFNNMINRAVYRIFNVSSNNDIHEIRHYLGLYDVELLCDERRLKFLKKARILPHVLLNVLSAKFLSFL